MKLLIIFTLIFGITLGIPTKKELLHKQWTNFKVRFNRQFENVTEEYRRYTIFQDNLRKINNHNKLFDKKLVTYKMGINRFADWNANEFLYFVTRKENITNNRPLTSANIFKSTSEIPLRKFVDWRSHGLVTKVKNQENCGSCWSFSATGSIEGQYAKKTGRLISLSEQNLIDCSTDYGNNGCNGGLMGYAFDYVKENGIEAEYDYSYEATDFETYCRYNSSLSITSISNYEFIEQENEEDLQQAIDKVGPISVAIEVTEKMQFYESGVFFDPYCSSTQLNHGVLAVGYGTNNNGDEYYIVKNSWSTYWGDEGYIRMARNRDNNCGIATYATYPII